MVGTAKSPCTLYCDCASKLGSCYSSSIPSPISRSYCLSLFSTIFIGRTEMSWKSVLAERLVERDTREKDAFADLIETSTPPTLDSCGT